MNGGVIFLLGLFFSVSNVQAAIEVYSAGQRFDSFEDYQSNIQNNPILLPTLTNAMSGSYESQPQLLSVQERLGIEHIGYDQGVKDEFVHFKERSKKGQLMPIFGSDNVEEIIREAIQNQHEPVLLISDSKKMRIVSFQPQNQSSSEENIENIDKTIKK